MLKKTVVLMTLVGLVFSAGLAAAGEEKVEGFLEKAKSILPGEKAEGEKAAAAHAEGSEVKAEKEKKDLLDVFKKEGDAAKCKAEKKPPLSGCKKP